MVLLAKDMQQDHRTKEAGKGDTHDGLCWMRFGGVVWLLHDDITKVGDASTSDAGCVGEVLFDQSQATEIIVMHRTSPHLVTSNLWFLKLMTSSRSYPPLRILLFCCHHPLPRRV